MVNKRGDVQMSFGFIFSIIIIIATISVAIYAVTIFIQNAERTKYYTITNTIEDEIIKARQADEYSQVITLNMPAKIDEVCFADLKSPAKGPNSNVLQDLKYYTASDDRNFFFLPLNVADRLDIHSDWTINCGSTENPINCLILSQNPLCIPVYSEKLSLRLVNPGDFSGKIIISAG